MNTRAKRQLVAGLIMAGFLGTAQGAAAGSADTNRTITIHVGNYAQVNQKQLIEAEKVASNIYRQVGVTLQWTDVPSAPQEQQETTGQKPYNLTDLRLSILPASMFDRLHLAKSVTGLAPGAGRDRTVAYVSYSRVQDISRMQIVAARNLTVTRCASMEQILGDAISHELGHILLNLEVHSETGIMRGNWGLKDLLDVAAGTLLFSLDQAEVIRTEVSRREALAERPEIASR